MGEGATRCMLLDMSFHLSALHVPPVTATAPSLPPPWPDVKNVKNQPWNPHTQRELH